MGWTVLYIAFGIVALWLLGEVLLQYKARLRWRLLAFVGFLGVVTGVMLGSVVVIGLGAAAFAVGQTYVTLSFRRGFSTGWALGGRPGASRRRRTDPGHPPTAQEPSLQVSDLEYEPAPPTFPPDAAPEFPPGTPATPPDAPPPAESPEQEPDVPVYAPQPVPDDPDTYGSYGTGTGPDQGPPPPSPGTDVYGYPAAGDPGYAPAGTDAPYAPAAAAGWDGPGANAPAGGHAPDLMDDAYDSYTPYAAYPGPDDHQYGYDTGQQYPGYAADPYATAPGAPDPVGAGGLGDPSGYGTQQMPGPYDPYGTQQAYGYPPGADPYADQAYPGQTPPGGVWMPQQRATEDPYGAEPPPEQPPYPYQGGADGWEAGGTGYDYEYRPDEQYRY